MAQQITPPPTVKPTSRAISFTVRKTGRDVVYTLTAEDFLELARAVEFEGPPQDCVAWTLLQRFAFLYPLYKSLAVFIRAYAQPINPAWFPNGPLHQKWAASLRSKGNAAAADKEVKAAQKRVVNASRSLESLSRKTHDTLAHVFTAGAATPVPGSTHYRAPTIATSDIPTAAKARAEFAKSHNMLDIVQVGDPRKENWFFGEPGSPNFRIRLIGVVAPALIAVCWISAAYALYTAYRG